MDDNDSVELLLLLIFSAIEALPLASVSSCEVPSRPIIYFTFIEKERPKFKES